ncbi:hypothetical protein [Rossellomorea sp. NS-SX7]|uniref:hypothetical protein n=1 Tax=Rossellomorea sp. NS-SX7 TaxID=3463856 RepID=UPI0040597B3E
MVKVVQLDQRQFELLQRYVGMLELVVEAMDYLEAYYTDYNKAEESRVLSDVFEALGKVSETNELLRSLFEQYEEITSVLKEYENVIDQALELNGHLQDPMAKEEIISNKLKPAFITWKTEADRIISPLLNN